MEQIKTYFQSIDFKDWAVIFATLIGPILAVQAQKFVEVLREKRKRKHNLFEQLMSTRASRLSPEHVRALNMIDLVFYGKITFGIHTRTQKEKLILVSWREYLDHLDVNLEHANMDIWSAKKDELFFNLLSEMAKDIGFDFDRVQLMRGIYLPIAHNELETEQTNLRKALISLIEGKHPLNMNIVRFPYDKEALVANKTAMQNIGKAFENGELQVTVTK